MNILRVLKLSMMVMMALGLKLSAQPSIKFDHTTHEFGDIRERGGKQTCTFSFENTGTEPLLIYSVRPSCGCTASEWTKEPIAPGKTGFISATYDPMNRPGPFRKSIMIQTNDPQNVNPTLFIAGNVIQGPKTKSDFYPVAAGHLRYNTNHLALMNINYGMVKTDSFRVYNEWDQPMKISFINTPAHMRLQAVPATLEAEAEGFIIVTYDSRIKNDFGTHFDVITLQTNDDFQPQKSLNVSANIMQDFSNLTPKQREKAPVASFDSLLWSFGTRATGELLTHTYTLTNNGHDELEILKIIPSCGCTTVEPETRILKRGKSTSISVTFNTVGREGPQAKTIKVITNDPTNPEITLAVHGLLIKQQ
jgi:hypothetical protein